MRGPYLLLLAAFPALSLAVIFLLPRGPAQVSVAKVRFEHTPGGKGTYPLTGIARLSRTAQRLELAYGNHRIALALDQHGYPGTFYASPEMPDKDRDTGMRTLFALVFTRELKGEPVGRDLLGATRVQWSDPYVARTEHGLYTSSFGPAGELLTAEGQNTVTGASHELTLSEWTLKPGAIEFTGLEPIEQKNN